MDEEALCRLYDREKAAAGLGSADSLLPFIWRGRIIGRVRPEVAKFLFLQCGFFFLEGQRFCLKETYSATPKAMADVFTQAYRMLLPHGMAMEHDERLDVFPDRWSAPVSYAPRGIFRAFGLITKSVHVTGFREGLFLMSVRSKTKKVAPGAYDSLAGGLIGAGEEEKIAAFREIYEESSLTPADFSLEKACSFFVQRPVPEGFLRECVAHYEAVVSPSAEPVCRDGSVGSFEKADEAKVAALIESGSVMPEAAFCYIDAIARINSVRVGGDFYRHPIAMTT